MCVVINIFEAPHGRLHWAVGPVSEQLASIGPAAEETIMLNLTDTQQCPISIAPVDKKGNAAPVQTVTFVSSDSAVVVVTPDAVNPLAALVIAKAPGVARITVTADADMGDGVTDISGTLDVSVSGGQAVSLAINVGTVVAQP